MFKPIQQYFTIEATSITDLDIKMNLATTVNASPINNLTIDNNKFYIIFTVLANDEDHKNKIERIISKIKK